MSEIALPPIPEPKRYPSGHYPDGVLTYSADQLMEFARQAVLQERERAAKVCDSEVVRLTAERHQWAALVAGICAAAIRDG